MTLKILSSNDKLDKSLCSEKAYTLGGKNINMRNTTIDREIAGEREELRKSKMAREKSKNNKKKKSTSTIQKIFTFLFSLGTVGIIIVLFLLYGPYNGFRDWLVTTAMTTMTHQYFATWFYDEDTINYILSNNTVLETSETTDEDLIVIGKNSKKTTYENEYERQILERDDKNDDYKIIDITDKKFDGYLVAVYDPSRIQAVVTANLGKSGQYVTKMAKDHDALIAINGGGFNDPNFNSTGGSPLGITVCNGKYVTTESYAGTGGIIGFTKEDKLVLGKMSLSEAKQKGIRDAVTFGPFLIVNGKASEILGNGGWGTAPRTAIAQRKDGIVLFLVVDGRTASKPGADMNDLIRILQNYGAYNAANLDGGTSSVLVVGDTIVNDPIDSTGAHKTRPISTAFIVTKDDSDDSDHTVVQSKLK